MDCKSCKSRVDFITSFDSGIPYQSEEVCENVEIRKFSSNINPNWLKWHSDLEDRIVIPVNDNDWKFQFDNELPIKIDKPIIIESGRIHRVIKGKSELIIKIQKNAFITGRISI